MPLLTAIVFGATTIVLAAIAVGMEIAGRHDGAIYFAACAGATMVATMVAGAYCVYRQMHPPPPLGH